MTAEVTRAVFPARVEELNRVTAFVMERATRAIDPTAAQRSR